MCVFTLCAFLMEANDVMKAAAGALIGSSTLIEERASLSLVRKRGDDDGPKLTIGIRQRTGSCSISGSLRTWADLNLLPDNHKF